MPFNYTYPKEYNGPKPIEEQIRIVAGIFTLDSSQALEYVKNLPDLMENVEGWFAIVSNEGLKKIFPDVTDLGEKNCRAIQLVHEKIIISRQFYSYRKGQITPKHLQIHDRTADALELIAKDQPGDILVVAGQLGMRYRNRSVYWVHKAMQENEFGLGAFAVGTMLLTHPQRLQRYDDLGINCVGDEFDVSGNIGTHFMCGSPTFDFSDGRIRFDRSWFNVADWRYGSASAFIPHP